MVFRCVSCVQLFTYSALIIILHELCNNCDNENILKVVNKWSWQIIVNDYFWCSIWRVLLIFNCVLPDLNVYRETLDHLPPLLAHSHALLLVRQDPEELHPIVIEPRFRVAGIYLVYSVLNSSIILWPSSMAINIKVQKFVVTYDWICVW